MNQYQFEKRINMKATKLFSILTIIAGGMLLSSCSFQIYPTQDMSFNYNKKMVTAEELTAKNSVKIFLNERDIQGEYQTISYVTYSPYTIPVFLNKRNQTIKKFYAKAVMKAYELGGNGIIVTGGGYCKVIKLLNWEAETKQATFVNVIFDRTLMDKFLNGTVAAEKKADRSRYEKAFKTEIKSNLRYATGLDEVAFIQEKINAYEKYTESFERQKKSIIKDVTKLKALHFATEKKVKARINRESKKTRNK